VRAVLLQRDLDRNPAALPKYLDIEIL